jgi:hypothetical protein
LRNDLFFLNKLYFIYRSEEKRKVWTTHSFLMHSQLAKVIAPGSHYLAIEVGRSDTNANDSDLAS